MKLYFFRYDKKMLLLKFWKYRAMLRVSHSGVVLDYNRLRNFIDRQFIKQTDSNPF